MYYIPSTLYLLKISKEETKLYYKPPVVGDIRLYYLKARGGRLEKGYLVGRGYI